MSYRLLHEMILVYLDIFCNLKNIITSVVSRSQTFRQTAGKEPCDDSSKNLLLCSNEIYNSK